MEDKLSKGLNQLLISKPPRESAGPCVFNRFSFQNEWALCHLLNLHIKNEDYLLVFDFHDDVLELDSSSEPAVVKFYQVKTAKTKAHWTPGQLLARKKAKGKPRFSYLGKLYHHTTLFDHYTDGLFFVSNVPIKVELCDNGDSTLRDELPFGDMAANEQAKVIAKIKDEHELVSDPSLDKFCFIVTPLSVDDNGTHALGHVTRFLTNRLMSPSVPAQAFFETLADEIKRRASWEYQPCNWKRFCEKKGISRAMMNEFLLSVVDQATAVNVGDRYLPELEKEGWSFGSREKIRNSLRSVEIDLMDKTDNVLSAIKRKIEDTYVELMESPGFSELGLSDLLEQVLRQQSGVLNALIDRKPVEYYQALCLVCIYEKAR